MTKKKRQEQRRQPQDSQTEFLKESRKLLRDLYRYGGAGLALVGMGFLIYFIGFALNQIVMQALSALLIVSGIAIFLEEKFNAVSKLFQYMRKHRQASAQNTS